MVNIVVDDVIIRDYFLLPCIYSHKISSDHIKGTCSVCINR